MRIRIRFWIPNTATVSTLSFFTCTYTENHVITYRTNLEWRNPVGLDEYGIFLNVWIRVFFKCTKSGLWICGKENQQRRSGKVKIPSTGYTLYVCGRLNSGLRIRVALIRIRIPLFT
jgi:hypothetical protein